MAFVHICVWHVCGSHMCTCRALLVSDAFSLNQFEFEANFMKEAANLESV